MLDCMHRVDFACIWYFQDAAERDAAKEKVEHKMEVRKMKKDLKKDLGVDKCKQQ